MNYNKKSIEDIDVSGKRVLCRCDFNVPTKNGKITSDKRIVAAMPTIEYLVNHGAKVILCSHMGKPKGEWKPELSLKVVAERISELGRGSRFDTQEISKDYQTMLRALVKKNTQTYIEDKAQELGGIIQAEVTVGSGEYPAPEHVVLTGTMTPEQAQRLESYVADSLGIPPEQQEWKLYG